MTFPLRATVVTPTFLPSHRGLAEELTVTQRGKILEKDVKEVAIKAAAASMALQIGLMFVPVVGWALGAVIALVQFFTSKHYEQKVKDILNRTKKDIQDKASSANVEVSMAASRVYDEEYKSAVALAASGTPLEGLGDFWSDIREKAKPIAKSVQKVALLVPKATVSISRVATKEAIKGMAWTADKTGHENLSQRITKFGEKGDVMAKDIEKRADDPQAVHELLSGRETAETAQARANDLKKTAFTQIDTEKNSAIALIKSPHGRETIRKQTALALRGSPDVLARMTQLNNEEAALMASLNNDNAAATAAINSMQPTVQTVSSINSTTALVGTGLAAAAAFLAFR